MEWPLLDLATTIEAMCCGDDASEAEVEKKVRSPGCVRPDAARPVFLKIRRWSVLQARVERL